MPETVISYPRQGAFSSAVSHLRQALHFDHEVTANAFTNPAITFELYAVEPEAGEAATVPIVPPSNLSGSGRGSGALPPLWQAFRAATQRHGAADLPLTAFANPAIADTRPINWAISVNEAKAKKRRFARAEMPEESEAAESWHEHALAYQSTGEFDAALECAEQTLQCMPTHQAGWRLRGTALLALQRWREAAQAFQRSLALRASDAEAWLGLGRAQLQMGEPEAALQSLGHALAQIPHYFEAQFYQGRAYFQLLHYEKACASYARAAELNADEALLWSEYAEALLRAHQPEAALECLETLTRLQPTNADHWISLGSLLREMLRPDEAVNSYDIALELAPQDFFAWFSRGLVLSDMRRYEIAGKNFERALALVPGEVAAQHQLALTYLPRFLRALAEGHVFDAREYWQRAIRLGRASGSADWYELELYYLQRAAALGHQQLVKALLNRLDGNALLEPLRHALDYLHTRNAERWAALPEDVRAQAETFVQRLGASGLLEGEDQSAA
jgi:tetratricopeptide (TPR) repeat protein